MTTSANHPIPGYENHEYAGLAFDPVGDPVVVADPDGRRIRINYVAEDPYPPEEFPHRDDGTFAGDVPSLPGVSTRIDRAGREDCHASWEAGSVYGIVSQTFRVDGNQRRMFAVSCDTYWGCLSPDVAAAAIGTHLGATSPAP